MWPDQIAWNWHTLRKEMRIHLRDGFFRSEGKRAGLDADGFADSASGQVCGEFLQTPRHVFKFGLRSRILDFAFFN